MTETEKNPLELALADTGEHEAVEDEAWTKRAGEDVVAELGKLEKALEASGVCGARQVTQILNRQTHRDVYAIVYRLGVWRVPGPGLRSTLLVLELVIGPGRARPDIPPPDYGSKLPKDRVRALLASGDGEHLEQIVNREGNAMLAEIAAELEAADKEANARLVVAPGGTFGGGARS